MIAFLNYYYHQGIAVLKLTLLQRERRTASLGNRKSKKQRPRETFRLVLSDPGEVPADWHQEGYCKVLTCSGEILVLTSPSLEQGPEWVSSQVSRVGHGWTLTTNSFLSKRLSWAQVFSSVRSQIVLSTHPSNILPSSPQCPRNILSLGPKESWSRWWASNPGPSTRRSKTLLPWARSSALLNYWFIKVTTSNPEHYSRMGQEGKGWTHPRQNLNTKEQKV